MRKCFVFAAMVTAALVVVLGMRGATLETPVSATDSTLAIAGDFTAGPGAEPSSRLEPDNEEPAGENQDGDNKPPVFASGSGVYTYSTLENYGPRISAGAFQISDPEGDALTFALAGADAAHFVLGEGSVGDEVWLALEFNGTPDYESPADANGDNVHEVTVQASDGNGTTEKPVRFTVRDVDEAPVITGLAEVSFPESSGTDVGQYTVADPEGEEVTLTLGGTDAGSFTFTEGTLRFNAVPDYETKSSYSVTFTSPDGTNTARLDVTITIIDVFEVSALQITTQRSSLEVSLDWDDEAGADYYLVRWRPKGGELNDGVRIKSSDTTIEVANYGQWVVRVQACNETGCSKPVALAFEVQPAPTPTPEPDPQVEFRVSITANSTELEVNQGVTLRAVITDAPEGGGPAYRWDADLGKSWRSLGTQSEFSHTARVPGVNSFRVTVTYGSGQSAKSATSAPVTVTWVPPNRPPAVDARAAQYGDFIETSPAPRGILVSKIYDGIFSDPDGDALTYTVSVPDDRRELVETIYIQQEIQRVFIRFDAESDWGAVAPALSKPLLTTVTLTATDPDGLSASVTGEFSTNWESEPGLLAVCDRTPQVRDALVETIGKNCEDIGAEDLARVNELRVANTKLTTFSARDVDGLTNLRNLDLSRNPSLRDTQDFTSMCATLNSMAQNVKRSLTDINWTGNHLGGTTGGTLWDSCFNGMPNLRALHLAANRIKTIRIVGDLAFDAGNDGSGDEIPLKHLYWLDLSRNRLTSLDAKTFKGLSGLAMLDLGRNKWGDHAGFASIHEDIFDGLTNLKEVRLNNNGLTSLNANLFSEPTNLEHIDLTNNGITSTGLPNNIFQPLTSLEGLALFGNPGSPFNLTNLGVRSEANVIQDQSPPVHSAYIWVVPEAGQATLSWEDPGDPNITHEYRYLASTGASPGSWANWTAANAPTMVGRKQQVVTGLTSGKSYLFAIRSVTGSSKGYHAYGNYSAIFGTAGPDVLTGSDGPDYMIGLGGNDTLIGRGGADRLDGGAGDDAVSYKGSPGGVEVDLTSNTGAYSDAEGDILTSIENLIGTYGDDDFTGDDNDNYLGGRRGDDTLNGGDGNDILEGGAGADTLSGGEGSDAASYAGSDAAVTVALGGSLSGGHAQGDTLATIENLIGSGHADTLTGDANNNVIEGRAGGDTIDCGGGSDTLSYAASGAAVTVRLHNNTASGGHAAGDTISNCENLTGSAHNDTLDGSSTANIIRSGDGDDAVHGGAGGDTLEGGAGADSLNGQGGADTLKGDDGDDTLEGGAGGDTLNGGPGSDVASYDGSDAAVTVALGGSGSGGHAQGDTLTDIENLIGSGHADTLTGDANDNVIEGRAGGDTINCGDGSDTLSYAASGAGVTVRLHNNTASGGHAASDTISNCENLIGSAHNDLLDGSSTANIIRSGAGDDNVHGGAGDDTLEGGAGADSLNGQGGTDTVSYASSASFVQVRLNTSLAQNGDATGDTISNFENVTGSLFGDLLVGNGNANVLRGLRNPDTLRGLDGNDTLIGGAGGDTLEGGDGSDTASYAGSDAGVTVNLGTGATSGGHAPGDTFSSIENLTGSAHGDTLTGDGNANVITGDGGDDLLEGAGGADTLRGGGGNDTMSYKSSGAAVTVNLADNSASGGHAQGDTWSGIENLIGSAHGDTLTGDANDNVIEGGNGGDTLAGGAGKDTLSYANSTGTVTVSLFRNYATGSHATGDTISGFENVTGSAHRDTLTGDRSANVLIGGAGNDTLEGRGGADTIDCGAGVDVVSYENSHSHVTVNLSTGEGKGAHATGDTISNCEYLIGSDHHDRLIGDSGNNVISGGRGTNFIAGDAGDDILRAGPSGIDYIKGGPGADLIIGGAGPNVAFYDDSPAGVHVDLSAGITKGGTAEGDTLINVQSILGSPHDDTLIGTDYDNEFYGSDGADAYDGKGQQDAVLYWYSKDGITLDLATPSNNKDQALGDTFVSIEEFKGSKNDDTITGDANDNHLSGMPGEDTVNGGAGDDIVWGGSGDDALNGGAGNDTMSGATGNDIMNGGADNDSMNGGAGDDTMNGDDGDDHIRGNNGDDIIDGGDGDDRIGAGHGEDTVKGGGGTDEFYFYEEFSSQTISDYASGEKIWICIGSGQGTNDGEVSWSDAANGSDWEISVSLKEGTSDVAQGTITLTGVSSSPGSDIAWSDPDVGAGVGCHFATAIEAGSAVLVSNIEQGYSGGPNLNSEDIAQGFTTGTDSAGYKLTSVEIDFAEVTYLYNYTASIVSGDSTGPGSTTVGFLRIPDRLVVGPGNSFSAPGGGLDLDANTTYYFVLDIENEHPNIVLRGTNADQEDQGAADGWSISNNRYGRFYDEGPDDWYDTSSVKLRILITGFGKTPPPEEPSPPPADSSTMVSNTGQTTETTGWDFASDYVFEFTTGNHGAGYTLTGLNIELTDAGGSPAYDLKIRDDAGNLLATLTNPSSFVVGDNLHTVSGDGLALDAQTSYQIFLDVTTSTNGGDRVMATTGSPDEDAGALSGWSIGNNTATRAWDSTSSYTFIDRVPQVSVQGKLGKN